ncbi:hypothetical protein [Luteibacter sp.]|uniref:hypothetical protein n=1 Tax=Luteibacter sp. TaxID=1886636 RepID=UPI003F80A303
MPKSDHLLRLDRRIGIAVALAGGLIGALIRWYYVTHAQVLQPLALPNVRADAVDYYRYAWNLAHHGTFASDPAGSASLHPSAYRDPGYPAFLAVLMLLTDRFETWYAAVLMAQVVLGGATVSVLLLAIRPRLPKIPLALTAALMAVWPHSVAMTSYVLSENLVAFLVALALLTARHAGKRGGMGAYAAVGGIVGLGALTNAVLAPVGVIVALLLAWQRVADRRALLALAICSLALPAAWGVRNLTMPFNATAAKRASMNLVEGSWPTFHAAYKLAMRGDDAGLKTIRAIDDEIASFNQGAWHGLATMCERMCAQPMTYLTWYARKPVELWGWDIQVGQGDIYVYPTRESPFRNQPIWRLLENGCFLLNPLIMLLASLGAISSLLRRPADPVESAMAAIVLAITVVYTVLQAEPRYAVPFRGPEIALAAIGSLALLRLKWPRSS